MDPPSTPVQHAPAPAATVPLTAGQKPAAEAAEDMDIEGDAGEHTERNAAPAEASTEAAAEANDEPAPAEALTAAAADANDEPAPTVEEVQGELAVPMSMCRPKLTFGATLLVRVDLCMHGDHLPCSNCADCWTKT